MSQVAQGPGRERLTRTVAAFSLAFSLLYIVWRWGWTLNTEALWFSVPLALAETYGLLTAFFLTFTAWSLRQRRPPAAPAGRTADVFVTTYDEPLTIIRKTALAAREIRYPHATWILDDGKRDEVKVLAEQLGVGYLRRPDRAHAKAGNLNYALQHTSGEFILQLDADHVPLPQMLDRLLGFFVDERVAFVQSPQDFYNTDAFTYDVNVRQRRIWEDQQLFFRVLQPGKDRVNAAFFVGSCAVIRRRAVEEIGGFGTKTITEDIETSLLLHAKGWRSVYLNESLAFGLAPATARAFHVQHLRWGQGAMQVLRRYRPLFMKGLTLPQRIGYLDSLSTYLGGFQRLILYLAPIVFFTTGVFPLQVSGKLFASVFLPYIALQVLSFKLLARGHGSLLLADRYAMAKFFTHVLAVTGYITRKPLRFRVTPKGADSTPLSAAVPQLAVVVLTLASLAWAVYERTLGYNDEIPGWGSAALWVNVVFALWNAAVAGQIVHLSLGVRHRRAQHRIAESLAVTFRVMRSDGKLSSTDIGVTENLNPSGLALRTMYGVAEGSRVEMALPLSTREVQIRGRVVHQTTSNTKVGTVHIVGVEFDYMTQDARDAIELHCSHHALPLERQRYSEGALTAGGALRRLLYLRAERRLAVGMPARVMSGTTASSRDLGIGLLEDVSPGGGRVLLDHPVAEGSLLTLEIPGSALKASGRVVFVHALETSLGMRFVAGFETDGDGTSKHTATRWFDEIARLAARYGTAARTHSRAAGVAAGQLLHDVMPHKAQVPPASASAEDARRIVLPTPAATAAAMPVTAPVPAPGPAPVPAAVVAPVAAPVAAPVPAPAMAPAAAPATASSAAARAAVLAAATRAGAARARLADATTAAVAELHRTATSAAARAGASTKTGVRTAETAAARLLAGLRLAANAVATGARAAARIIASGARVAAGVVASGMRAAGSTAAARARDTRGSLASGAREATVAVASQVRASGESLAAGSRAMGAVVATRTRTANERVVARARVSTAATIEALRTVSATTAARAGALNAAAKQRLADLRPPRVEPVQEQEKEQEQEQEQERKLELAQEREPELALPEPTPDERSYGEWLAAMARDDEAEEPMPKIVASTVTMPASGPVEPIQELELEDELEDELVIAADETPDWEPVAAAESVGIDAAATIEAPDVGSVTPDIPAPLAATSEVLEPASGRAAATDAMEPPTERSAPVIPFPEPEEESDVLFAHDTVPDSLTIATDMEPVTAMAASEPMLQTPPTIDGADPMESRQSSHLDSTLSSPPLLVVRGTRALLEGSFDIEDSIEVECEVRGDLTVGGTLVIGERGRVAADVTTVNAVILGHYTGKMTASGSIEIAATGRADGTLTSNELVIAKGGIFTGSVARTGDAGDAASSSVGEDSPRRIKQTEQTANRGASSTNGPTPSRTPNAGLADVKAIEPDRGTPKDRPRSQEVPLA